MPDQSIFISETLKALLRYTKGNKEEVTVESINKALETIYGSEMRLKDTLHHVVNVYMEVLRDPRFQAPYDLSNNILELLISPVNSFFACNGPLQSSSKDVLCFEDIILAQMRHMLSVIMLTRIDWCRHVIWSEDELKDIDARIAGKPILAKHMGNTIVAKENRFVRNITEITTVESSAYQPSSAE